MVQTKALSVSFKAPETQVRNEEQSLSTTLKNTTSSVASFISENKRTIAGTIVAAGLIGSGAYAYANAPEAPEQGFMDTVIAYKDTAVQAVKDFYNNHGWVAIGGAGAGSAVVGGLSAFVGYKMLKGIASAGFAACKATGSCCKTRVWDPITNCCK